MANGIGAADENVQSGGITHGILQMLEPLLGVSEALGFQVGNAKKVGSFKVGIEGNGGLEIADGGRKISAIEIDAAEDVLGTGVTRIIGDNGLGKQAGFLDVPGAEPSYGSIDSDIRIGRGEFESFVQLASCFVEPGFGNGKSGELAEAESDGLVVVTFGFGEVAGGEGGLGGFESALEESGRIVGGTSCYGEQCRKNNEEYSFRTTTQ